MLGEWVSEAIVRPHSQFHRCPDPEAVLGVKRRGQRWMCPGQRPGTCTQSHHLLS